MNAQLIAHNQHSYETIVVGGGQAGLTTGYYLKEQGADFAILDASQQIGDSWRNRWDSLRLFTPARYNGLPGMTFPAPAHSFPTKDQMGDFLETYAHKFELPVRSGVWVDRLTKQDGRFILTTSGQRFEAENVVVAMSDWQKPHVPPFAGDLDASILQMHSTEYQKPAQLRAGSVLVVGAGNSGAEIALEVARDHRTWLSGRDIGHIPFPIESFLARHILIPFVLRFLFHRVMTVNTPMGRKARTKILDSGMPLVRTRPSDLRAAGVERIPRIEGIRDRLPFTGDGREIDAANVIWSTGFRPGFSSWIELPVFDADGLPIHERGVVDSVSGMYFVGLQFLFAESSSMVHGSGRDAKWIVEHIVSQAA